jgi:hypothetical protein
VHAMYIEVPRTGIRGEVWIDEMRVLRHLPTIPRQDSLFGFSVYPLIHVPIQVLRCMLMLTWEIGFQPDGNEGQGLLGLLRLLSLYT